jgi:hypothetical protein
MANRARINIWVTQTRSESQVRYSTVGMYGRLPVNTIADQLLGQPLFTTASAAAFWQAVIPVVLADIAAKHPV